jgi:hypothetical protein
MIGRKMDNTARELGRKIISELEKISHSLTRAPGKQNETSISPQQTPSQENNPRPREPRAITQVGPTQTNTEQAKYPWYTTLEGWKIIAELIAIPFAIGYAVVTYFQWKDLRHNFEVDQRALVKIGFDIPNAIDPVATLGALQVTALNTGKSPALRARIDASVEIVEYSTPPTFSFSKSHGVIDVGMLFPNDPMKLSWQASIIFTIMLWSR